MSWLTNRRASGSERSRGAAASAASPSASANFQPASRPGPPCERFRERLSALLDGELSETETKNVERHLSGCASCKAEMRSLELYSHSICSIGEIEVPESAHRALFAALRTEAAAAECLDLQPLLSAYLDAETTLEEREAVQAHTRRCVHCAEQFAGLQRTTGLIRALPPVNPPRGLRDNVLSRTTRRGARVPAFSLASAGLLAAAAIGLYLAPAPPAPREISPTPLPTLVSALPAPVSAAGGPAAAQSSPAESLLAAHRSDTVRRDIAVKPAVRHASTLRLSPAPTTSPLIAARPAPMVIHLADRAIPAAQDIIRTTAFPPHWAASFSATRKARIGIPAPASRRQSPELIPSSAFAHPSASLGYSGAPASLGAGETVPQGPAVSIAEAPHTDPPVSSALSSPTSVSQSAGPSQPHPHDTVLVLAAVRQDDLTDGVWSEDQALRNRNWTRTANIMVESTVHTSHLFGARRRGVVRTINGSPVLTAAASGPFHF